MALVGSRDIVYRRARADVRAEYGISGLPLLRLCTGCSGRRDSWLCQSRFVKRKHTHYYYYYYYYIGWVLIRVLLSRTGSAMSLASGLVFGGLLTYGAARLSANSKDTLFAFGERIKMYTKSSAHSN